MTCATRTASILLPLALLASTGCDTSIAFENQVPNASIENVRWETDDGQTLAADQSVRLLPGQKSEPISVYFDENETSEVGRIHFELVADGRKVGLVTARTFEVKEGETKTFKLTPSTTATNPLASLPTDGSPVAAEPNGS